MKIRQMEYKNKDGEKEKFYPMTHVKAIVYGKDDLKTFTDINDNINELQIAVEGKANKETGIFYIEGTGDTDGVWLGSHEGITSYYPGLMVMYKIPIDGLSTGTTLNINNLGAVNVVRNVTTAISTAYAVNAIILLTYTIDGATAYWKIADYNSNTNTLIRLYRQNSGYNEDYPLLVSRTAVSKVGTAGENSSYTNVYGVMWDDTTKVPTINPSTGAVKVASLSVGGNEVSVSGHKHGAGDITSGTLSVANGGTGNTTFASGAVLIGGGQGAITTKNITDNTSSTAVSGTNLVTANTVNNHVINRLNRSDSVTTANTSYGTFMARAIAAGTSTPTSLTNGVIYLQY